MQQSQRSFAADYDALGRRIRRIKHDIGETRLYFYNDNWQVLEEYEVGMHGTYMAKQYVYGNYIDEALKMSDDTDSHYYIQDHLYSPVALLDTNGSTVERYEYNAYGQATVYTDKGTDNTWLTPDDNTSTTSSPIIANEYTFTGRRLDSLHANQLPLMQYRHRYYDPQMGRFLTRDPAKYINGLNLYQYCQSRPLVYVDPAGLFIDDVVGGIIDGGSEIIGGIGKGVVDIGGGVIGGVVDIGGSLIEIAPGVIGKVWNSPNTAIGLGFGFIGVGFGGEWPHFGHNGINFTYSPWTEEATAITFGNSMIYGEGCGKQGEEGGTNFRPLPWLPTYGNHEEQHTYQGEILGPFYLPAHAIDWIINGGYG
ncbi:Cell wall-associated polypeptide CWBP200 [Anaerohalosphaera lusitana]|uniref:Cell wall-associated polypeptide CWBP200 n=1 Tax=Anaerohalosphaera lusitana TaxID=1936003 RepID=A0A1U9NGR5_9BACT|nr:RHS repeat-associated core domain-containing protein [Anaerohalosphaera lusitana]AQT67131.1 Cell wall-associated polypeptide CWBP200 [Anaerohalosphaera lusitana]